MNSCSTVARPDASQTVTGTRSNLESESNLNRDSSRTQFAGELLLGLKASESESA